MITKNPVVYTDGSHKNQWGSWAYVVIENNQVIYEASGPCRNTDSLRMEIQAAIEALQYLHQCKTFEIHTDCRILIENLAHFSTWKSQGWQKKNLAPIPNVDLYQKLDDLLEGKQIQWKWVRAHSMNPYNERCDQLCREARVSN